MSKVKDRQITFPSVIDINLEKTLWLQGVFLCILSIEKFEQMFYSNITFKTRNCKCTFVDNCQKLVYYGNRFILSVWRVIYGEKE